MRDETSSLRGLATIPLALSVLSAASATSGCVVAKQYTLKLDAARPAENALCERSSRDSARAKPGAPPVERCAVFAGQALDSPSTLAITIANADPNRHYVARVQQTARGPGGDEASAVFQEALARLKEWARGVVAAADGTAEDAARAEETALERLRGDLLEKGLSAASKRAEDLMPRSPADEPRAAAEVLFGGPPGDAGTAAYLVKTAKGVKLVVPELDPSVFETVFGMPATPYPAPRHTQLDATDLAYLELHLPAGTARRALAALVVQVCAPDSFGAEPYTGNRVPWKDYVGQVDWKAFKGDELLRNLGVHAGDVLAFFKGEAALDVEKLLRDARRRAATAIQAGQPPADADRVVHQLYAFSRLHRDADACLGNVAFATELAKGDAGLIRQLKNIQAPLADLARQTTSPAEIFATVFEPHIRRVIIHLFESAGKSTISFGALSVSPGTVNVAVTEQSTSSTRDIATYELQVQRSSLVTIAIGPMITLCNACIQHIVEKIEPGEEMGDEARRILLLARDDYTYSLATMVNFGLVTASWFQLAAGIGYPVSDISHKGGIDKGALLGLTARHRVGVGISLGLHFFEGQRLKPGYGRRIDTTEPGLSGLTTDNVVESRPRAAVYFSAGIDSGLLEKLF